MSGESFLRRVQVLRDSWAERRELKGLTGVHDFASQLTLLQTLYTWAEGSVGDITAVYGDELPIGLSPPPRGAGENPAFSLTLGDVHTVAFSLSERPRLGSPRWSISVTVSSGGSIVAAGPERRNGQWTRSRLEDVLLSVLGAHERSNSEAGPRPAPGPLRAR